MIVRLVIALVLIAVAWFIGRRLDRRAERAAPVSGQDSAHVPEHLDRNDFPRPEAECLLVLFSSATCGGCAEMSEKVAGLDSAAVAAYEVDYETQRELQEKYSIDIVPMVLVADADGVVRAHTLGNVPENEVRAAVFRARGGGPERLGPARS